MFCSVFSLLFLFVGRGDVTISLRQRTNSGTDPRKVATFAVLCLHDYICLWSIWFALVSPVLKPSVLPSLLSLLSLNSFLRLHLFSLLCIDGYKVFSSSCQQNRTPSYFSPIHLIVFVDIYKKIMGDGQRSTIGKKGEGGRRE